MVSACIEAFRATEDPSWSSEAKRAFEWFLGRNDLDLPLYDSSSGGCSDGLQRDRVNENQGAESTLAFHLSLAEMSGMDHLVASPAVRGSMSPSTSDVTRRCSCPRARASSSRPFIPGNAQRVTTVIGRALALSEEDAVRDLKAVLREFDSRHLDIESRLLANFERVLPELFTQRPISRERKLLIGALFSGEYALESAALFNPSIVSHPDQGGVEEGGLRFVMSLRATGEGHISSIEFRTGILASGGGSAWIPFRASSRCRR